MQARRDIQVSPRVCFPGIADASPLGMLLRASVWAVATTTTEAARPNGSQDWMHTVRGTSLQWWGEDAKRSSVSGEQSPHDSQFFVDFFGLPQSLPGYHWRLVDGSGEPILHPFCMLEGCYRFPFITSVVLIGRTSDSDWTMLADAHLSSRLPYRQLLQRVGHASAMLITTALRKNDRLAAKRWRVPLRAPARSKGKLLAHQLRVRIAQATYALRLQAFNERWAIGVRHISPRQLLQSQALKPDWWLAAGTRRAFLADPFPHPREPGTLLCERFNFRTGLGGLRAIRVVNKRIVNEHSIDLNIAGAHVSYPYTYEEHRRTFLLPEMAAFGKLMLFELLSGGDTRLVSIIDRGDCGRRIADPTLFVHNGFYWIAYSDLTVGRDDNLCLLYSKQLQGPWVAHLLNPVKVDVRSSRPAGTPFVVNGQLYRPAQDCSRTYGGAVAINRVDVCSLTAYEEQPVAILTPDTRGAFPHGLHTLALKGDTIFIDGKRQFIDFPKLLRSIVTRTQRHARDN